MRKTTICLLITLFTCPPLSVAGELTVYTSRNPQLLKPLFDDYSREMSVAVSYVRLRPEDVISQVALEGEQSRADVVLLTGAVYLRNAAERNLLASVRSRTLEKNVPVHLRDLDNRWFGLWLRARAIVYNADRVDPARLDTYAGLAELRWNGRLCLSAPQSLYNRSMVAMLIQRHGETAVENAVRGWVANLAASPLPNDPSVLEAIAAGRCDVGIANSYYLPRLQRRGAGAGLALFWPDQRDSGVHVNVFGGGVARHAPNPSQALDLLEWLSTRRPQADHARISLEYPVNPKAYPPRIVAKWGKYRQDQGNLGGAGRFAEQAANVMERAGYR